jgi:DNA invertase Pin-like site-specific DNA recombinase
MQGKFVAYYRVSTERQGRSGLGLDAQQASVMQYLNGGRWTLVGEFTEVETGKGKDALDKRPKLREALALSKKMKATLVVARLDRLARNVHFLTSLMESKVKFVAVDMPQANEFTVHIIAAVAQHEAKRIGERTKAALAAAKARGVKLGTAGPTNIAGATEKAQEAAQAHAEKLRATLKGLQAQRLSQRAIADELNALGIPAPRGGAWHLPTVQRVLARLERR